MALLNYEKSPGVLKSSQWGVSPAYSPPQWATTQQTPALATALATAGKSATATGKSPMGQEPPKFDVLMNVKDPEIDKAASSSFAKAQTTNTAADSLFGKYLKEIEERSAPAKARLDAELNTYDTASTNLEKSLSQNLENQRASFAKARELDVKKVLGDDERYSLMRGLGASGEQDRTFADSYYKAVLPYEQRMAELGRANIGDVYASRLSTADKSRNATNAYLSSLTEPAQRTLALQGLQQGNLAASAALMASNRFYTPYSDDPRLVPLLPTPSGGYNVPRTPNYGGVGTPVRSSTPTPSMTPPSRPPPLGTKPPTIPRPPLQSAQGRERFPQEIAYYNQTGKWPDTDRNFSQELWDSLFYPTPQPPARTDYSYSDIWNTPAPAGPPGGVPYAYPEPYTGRTDYSYGDLWNTPAGPPGGVPYGYPQPYGTPSSDAGGSAYTNPDGQQGYMYPSGEVEYD